MRKEIEDENTNFELNIILAMNDTGMTELISQAVLNNTGPGALQVPS